ncbi:hypothetical protein CKY28_12210 [Sphingomonas lenta]|uniref:Uncharacterized protein n=2 Tax=Sphingomonas lenta TaxID=1141887 RepID=A0A2A2SC62_9SPHN|nr:hypothetical protein CKY28_12210 [Sphingomonas lenta]
MIATIAAAGLLGTSAMAQTTAGGGASASSPHGSVAGGATAGTNDQGMSQREQRRQQRMQRRGGNSSSTYGSGTIYTDRNRATGGVTAGGTATGSGRQSSSTAVDAYGQATRQGSTAEVYGDSTANSGDRPQ